jgi:WhiB family transcriptional regulator, redox-sensing transcriptional regulator
VTTTPLPTEPLHLDFDERPWVAYASCRDADPEIFFPSTEDSVEAAVRICSGCPVREECLEWALDTRVRYGIWGGLTEKQRRRLLRRTA